MAGGLSSGPGAPNRSLGQEFPQILNTFRTQEGQLNKFVNRQQLLLGAETLGLDFAGGIGSLLAPLFRSAGQVPGQFGNFSRQTGALGASLPNIERLES